MMERADSAIVAYGYAGWKQHPKITILNIQKPIPLKYYLMVMFALSNTLLPRPRI